MGLFGWIIERFRGRGNGEATPAGGESRHLFGRYDVAQQSDQDRHWMLADQLSAAAANNYVVRKTIRQRARYEYANNCYCWGIVDTFINDVLGVGPQLQVYHEYPDYAKAIEVDWRSWARQGRLLERLYTAMTSRIVDGEVFLLLRRNPNLPLEFEILPIECDRVTVFQSVNNPLFDDGITYDEYGQPVSYQVLVEHPGGFYPNYEWTEIDARYMLHWYRVIRPGQRRGISELTPALPLFADLRRYTLAVLGAAELAASYAGVIYTELPPQVLPNLKPFDPVELQRRALITLPAGWKMGQITAEQPSLAYGDFKRELVAEIGRVLGIPRNIATLDSAGLNFASGRLDHLTYQRRIVVERTMAEQRVLDPLFRVFLDNWHNLNPQWERVRSVSGPAQFTWFWQGRDYIDPAKEVAAKANALANGLTTLTAEWANRGMDFEEVARLMAKEREMLRSLGLDLQFAPPIEPIDQEKQSLDDEEEGEDLANGE